MQRWSPGTYGGITCELLLVVENILGETNGSMSFWVARVTLYFLGGNEWVRSHVTRCVHSLSSRPGGRSSQGALTKATAMWQSLDVADALSYRSSQFWECFCLMVQSKAFYPRRGRSFVSKCSQPSGQTGRYDFVAWVLRVVSESAFAHTCGDHSCYYLQSC